MSVPQPRLISVLTIRRSPFPWFYPVFFCCMITHRAWRDIHRCRTKYGEAWLEYERQVPYLFIPVSSPSTSTRVEYKANKNIST